MSVSPKHFFSPFTHEWITDRTKRVKDARSEAQKEIDEYRESKESEFKDFEKEVRLPPLPSGI